jgi:uncharacterized oxidoreductase
MSEPFTLISADQLRRAIVRIFVAAGLRQSGAAIVADDLVDADLCGLTSHGVYRVAQYIEAIQERGLRPGVELVTVRQTPATGIYDCGWNLGIVSAHQLIDRLLAKVATAGLAAVVGTQCYHIGRLGSFTRRIAKSGFLGFVVAAGTARCHYVVPWGGREGRMATNPMSYGVPCDPEPLILDMSTSMYAEGKVRAARTLGQQLPEGVIVDGHGRPSTDPGDFYAQPHGNILPFGGPMGYKGFGLSVLVEVLGRCLAGQLVTQEDKTYRLENGVFMAALSPAAFCGHEPFAQAIADLSSYITSASPAPGHQHVQMPGEHDAAIRRRRLAEGIPLPDAVRTELLAAAARVGLHEAALFGDSPAGPSASNTPR